MDILREWAYIRGTNSGERENKVLGESNEEGVIGRCEKGVAGLCARRPGHLGDAEGYCGFVYGIVCECTGITGTWWAVGRS